MKDTKEGTHTPGPWRTLDDDQYRVVANGLVAESSYWWYDKETAKANACLIAAAPDLLDALYLALPYVEHAATMPDYKPGPVNALAACIRATLSKAEGR